MNLAENKRQILFVNYMNITNVSFYITIILDVHLLFFAASFLSRLIDYGLLLIMITK